MSDVVTSLIHSTAIVHPSAKIGDNVTIGPWSIIGKDVSIGENTQIASNVIIDKYTTIGTNNKIYPYSSIGIDPQDKKYSANDICTLEIGDNNVFREYLTISRGTSYGGGLTKIGSNNLIMAYSHIAHDCIVGNSVVFANNTTLSGHVIVEDFATISGFGGLHQFCRMGQHSFLGMRATVSQDIAPYMLVAGAEPRTRSINTVGLKRRGFHDATIRVLRECYKEIYRSGSLLKNSCNTIAEQYGDINEVKILLDFISKSERGLLR